jgi:hypothetical protein
MSLQVKNEIALEETGCGCTLVARLAGTRTLADGRSAIAELRAQLEAAPYAGVVLDIREACFQHTLSQFEEAADLFAEAVGTHRRVSVIYSDAQLFHATFLTRRLKAAGRDASAFRDLKDANAFACPTAF